MNIHRLLALVLITGLGFLSATPACAQVTRGYSGSQIFSTYGGDKDDGEPDHCGEPGGASAWFVYQAPTDGAVAFDTRGSTFDTVLAVYTGAGTDFGSLALVTCNRDAGDTQTWSQVGFPVTAGAFYFIAVDGVGGASGTVHLNYGYLQAPTVTNLPASQVVAEGDTLELSAGASDTAGATYQWTWNEQDIPEATNATMRLVNFQAAWKGKYKIKIKNAVGETASAAIGIYEAGPPRIVEHQKPAANRFKLRAAGWRNATYLVQCSPDLVTWITVATNTSTTGVVDYEDLCPAEARARYYRVVPAP